MQRKALAEVMAEKERASANLRASEELFRAFMNASPFLSYIKDAAGRLLFYNRSFAQRFGVSEYAWLGRTDEQLWSRKLTKSVRTHDLEVMAGGTDGGDRRAYPELGWDGEFAAVVQVSVP